MQRRVFPEVEFVTPEQLQQTSLHNQAFLEAKYQGDVTHLRAEIIQRMVGHSALSNCQGWMVFKERPAQESGVLVEGEEKSTLLVIHGDTPVAQNVSAPFVRVLTNTLFRLDGEIAILSEDITIDPEHDAQMLVDVMFLRACGDGAFDQVQSEFPSRTPVFWVDDSDTLHVGNYTSYTNSMSFAAILDPDGHGSRTIHVLPFGLYTNIEDRIAALDTARSIVQQTDKAELVATSA